MLDVDLDAVLFDLDGTICEYRRSRQAALEDAFERVGVDPFFTAAEFEEWIPKVDGDDQFDLRLKCFTRIAAEKGYDPDIARRVAESYQPRDPTEVTFTPGAGEALESLSTRYTLGLVTNGNAEMQRAKLSALGIESEFSASVFATPESALKPDPDPFLRALDGIDTPPDRAVYVGDSPETDVRGANAVGLTTVLVAGDRSSSPRSGDPDYTVSSLRPLRSL